MAVRMPQPPRSESKGRLIARFLRLAVENRIRTRVGIGTRVGMRVAESHLHGEATLEADRSINLAQRAVAEGYCDARSIEMDAGLDHLRLRPDFQALMMDLTFPIIVFAD